MSIEVMKQATDQLEIGLAYPGMRFYHDNIRAVITTLRAAIEAAKKQEPVAWAVFEGWNAHDLYLPQEYDEALKMAGYKGDHAEVKPLYTTPPTAPQPVTLEAVYETIIQWDEGGKRSRRELARRIAALHTTPPAAQRQWVGLTGDEREQIYQAHHPDALATAMAAVENKLKQKNT